MTDSHTGDELPRRDARGGRAAADVRNTAAVRNRNLRTVLGLAALFFVPIGGAMLLYYGIGWSPSGHVNHGELILPARPLPAVSLAAADTRRPVPNVFTGRWALVYVGDGQCDPDCRFALYLMRNTRLDLGNEATRVERVFLLTGSGGGKSLAHHYPGMIVLDASASSARKLVAAFPTKDLDASIFIVDPLGNLLMRYDSRRDPMGLLEDLQRLLRLSQIG
ncbi:MAG: SCO family protein [Steroidobacteraceae bacterium]